MSGYRLIRPETAFSVIRQRRPRDKKPDHLKFIAKLVCCLCGASNPDPAHLRAPYPQLGKRATGMAEKPDDKWTVPLCRREHDEQHAAGDEVAWWQSKGINPFPLA